MDSNLTIRQPHLMNSATSMTTFFEYIVFLFFTMLLGKVMLLSKVKSMVKEGVTKKEKGEDEISNTKHREEKNSLRLEACLKDVEERLDDVDNLHADIKIRIAVLFEEEERNKKKIGLLVEEVGCIFEEVQRNKKQMGEQFENLKRKVDIMEKDLMELKEHNIMKETEEQEFILLQYRLTDMYQKSFHIPGDMLVKLIQKKNLSLDRIYFQAWKPGRHHFVSQSWMANATEYDLCQLAICVYNHWYKDIQLMLCPGCCINPSIVEKYDYIKLLKAEEIFRNQYGKMETSARDYMSKIRKVIEKLKIIF